MFIKIKHMMVLVLLGAVSVMTLSACEEASNIKSITLQTSPRDSYIVDDELSEDWNKLVVEYKDGKKEYLPGDDERISITGDTSSIGEKEATVTFEDVSITYTYKVYNRLLSTVNVTGGDIVGYRDGDVEIYKGIPYAASTSGDQRWHAPKDVEPWEGVKETFVSGESAPQQKYIQENANNVRNYVGMGEDCLKLDVWTTGTDTLNKPVIVYIHGGGGIKGGSSIPIADGTNMAKEDVVFVSISYRLGNFAFMVSDELKAENDGAGNLAMLDQIKALEWVQDNIEQFGGDKDNVTVTGQSYGARAVSILLASPRTEGLFAHAAMFSGNAIEVDHDTIDEKISKTDLNGVTLEQMRAYSTSEVLKMNVTADNVKNDEVLPHDLPVAFEQGINKDVDVLMSIVPGDSVYNNLEAPGVTIEEILVGKQNLLAEKRIAGGGLGKNYVLWIDYALSGGTKAEHTDDMPLWFRNSANLYNVWNDKDQAMAMTMSTYLINFAKYGDPNYGSQLKWEVSTGNGEYYKINRDMSIEMLKLTEQQMESIRNLYPLSEE